MITRCHSRPSGGITKYKMHVPFYFHQIINIWPMKFIWFQAFQIEGYGPKWNPLLLWLLLKHGGFGKIKEANLPTFIFELPQFSPGAWASESKRLKYNTLQWIQASWPPAFGSPVISRIILQYLITLVQIRPTLHLFWCSVHLSHENIQDHIISPWVF